MASNYTCRACSRVLSRPSSFTSSTQQLPRKTALFWAAQCHRTLASQAAKPADTNLDGMSTANLQREIRNNMKTAPMQGLAAKVRDKVREKAPLLTETYAAYGATQKLFKECAGPGDYQIPQALENGGEIPTDESGVHLGVGTGWWYESLGLAPTFNNWAQISFVYMYMLQVRFRMFPDTHAPLWIQHMTNQCFYAAEDRLVVWHKFSSNSLRQKYLKDLFTQWRGVLLSYDEGMVKGDAMLAAALWRNLLGGREDVDFEKLAQVVAFMRREIKRLDQVSDDEVARADFKFRGDPGQEAEAVKIPSIKLRSEKEA